MKASLHLIYLLFALPFQPQAQVKKLLPGSVNTVKFTEYAPSISADGQTLIYETDRAAGAGGWELYQADMLKNGTWSLPRSLTNINTHGNGKDLIGGPSISYDGNTLFFFAFLEGKEFKSYGREDIYYAVREKDGWSKPINLGPTINSPVYEGFPSISADGKRLYFMRGVFDGSVKSEYSCYKLMMAERGRDGSWKQPIELPAPINIACEKAPRIMADNRTLIFSSVRKGGKGDFDLYKSVLQDDGSWSEPINLSFVNTKGLDQFVSIPPCGDVMYFTNGGDIYTVPVPEDLRPTRMASVQGFVTDSLTGQPVLTKVVAFNEQGQRTISEMDNNASDGRFTVILETGKQYTLQITQPGYYRKTIQLPPEALSQCGTFMQDIQLTPILRASGSLLASATAAPAGPVAQPPVAAASPALAPTPEKLNPSPQAKVSAGKAVVTFQAFDKQTSKTIGATFQLTSLKTKRKLSIATTPQRPTLSLTFTESDTLYIITSAKGYGDVSEPLWVGVDTEGETRYEYRAYLPPTLGSTLVVNVADAEINQPVPGLKIILQDETTGQSTPLTYDPKSMTARTTLDPSHRYTVAVDAPGYTPYRKYINKVLNENEVGIQLPRKVQSLVALAATDQRTQKPIAATFTIVFSATRQSFVVEGKVALDTLFVFGIPGTYQIEASAPGYRSTKKEFVIGEKELKAYNFKPALVPAATEYTFLVVDKDQRSVVPNATVKVFDEAKNAVNVSNTAGEFTVMLPDAGTFTYEASAAEYQLVRGTLDRPASRLIEVGMSRRITTPLTQTIAFVAQDAFTQKPLAARFRLNNAETNTSATVTTAANPEFGTELKLKQPYLLEVESDGYANYSAPITLDVPEAEPIKPRVIRMEPLAYEVNFTILDAVTMKPIDPTSFKIGEAGKALNLQSQGNARKVLLSSGKQYDIRVGQPGYELFERTLTFDKPTGPRDLLKSILLSPMKAQTKPTPTVASAPAATAGVPAAAKVDETVFENLKVGEAVRLDNVYFDQSSYILRTESYPQLDKLVKTLQVNAKLKIEIAGHTDNVGDARLNQYLSENRARVISSYLANKGIAKDRLVPTGYGQTKPVAPNDTEENKAQNRRVEFVVLEN
jgi:outer membrane protein OmpA-like peptidoglycan-associated protein/Tol biopolymer transport system component